MSNTKETEDLILIQNILNGNQASQEILYNKYKSYYKNVRVGENI